MTPWDRLHHRPVVVGFTLVLAVGLAAGCGQSGDAPAPASGAHGPSTVVLRTNPNPATVGKNTFEVTVQAPNGAAVSDAEVTVKYSMVGMSSMNHELKLQPAGQGRYTGDGDIQMAGSWDVTVVARRDGQEIANQKLTIAAK